MVRRLLLHVAIVGFAVGTVLAMSAPVSAQPCLIFVHGKQTEHQHVHQLERGAQLLEERQQRLRSATATKNFATSYYVVGYNGTRPYWESQSAGEVANEIVNATNGGADGGGNRCARTFAQGGTFWVIAPQHGRHRSWTSSSATTTPATRTSTSRARSTRWRSASAWPITLGGAHRGSQGADAVCGNNNLFCNFLAFFIQSCDTATYWLRSADDVQVRTVSNAPAKNV